LSFDELLRVMSRARVLTEREFDEIVADLREQFERRLEILSGDEIQASVVGQARFHLEFDVVAPLYYRLQRHLIDWGTRTHHPGLSKLKLTELVDQRGYKYNDIIPLKYRGDIEQ